MQLAEASTDEAWRIQYFPLSLTGPAFTWAELKQKFHSYFFTVTNEKKLVDHMSLR
jgi:hypothetical protein